MSPQIKWSHPSVRTLLKEAGAQDPFDEIARRARELAIAGLEAGWDGPPFDPFELAERTGVETVPREDLDDARLVSAPGESPRIEFNPRRRPARVRFSVAHELGHLLFSDHADQVRYRQESHTTHRRADDWQLEILCNVAAAELLMPVGAFPTAEADDLSLPHLLDLRPLFGVSTEALLRRVVKLTERPVSLFATARLRDGRYRLDYVVHSRAWHPAVRAGEIVDTDTVLSHCTAVGFSADGVERWPGLDDDVRLQAVGVPPYPGDRFPRVIGLVQPVTGDEHRVEGVRYLRGDATNPQRHGATIIGHVVNDSAQRWGGHGFAPALGDRFPAARALYTEWAADRSRRRLGAVHLEKVEDDLWVASLVAQAGYGDDPTGRPRLRLHALRQCLEALADAALERRASVHMPPIGTGQGATPWPPVRDLVLDELVNRGVPVTVYVLPDQPMPDEAPAFGQLTLA